jgi:hypothetical protein
VVESGGAGASVSMDAMGAGGAGGSAVVDAGPACKSTGDCSRPTPYCDTQAGRCVACLGDGNCTGGGGFNTHCDLTTHSCVRCLDDSHCGGQNPYCSPAHTCVQCLTAGNCGDAGLTCDMVNYRCTQSCTGNGNCAATAGTPYCDTTRGVCVRCVEDMNCGGGNPYCLKSAGRCVECLTDPNCGGGGNPYCQQDQHRCVECLTNANCGQNGFCLPDFSCR